MKQYMKTIVLTIAGLLAMTNSWGARQFDIVAAHGTVTPTVNDSICTLTVLPDDGYYIRISDIIVEKMLDPKYANVRTRTEGPAMTDTIMLAGNDPQNLAIMRSYTFTMPDTVYILKVMAAFQTCERIANSMVSLSADTLVYDGKAKEPEVIVLGLTEGWDYNVEYHNNVEVGTAYVTVSGLSTYTGIVTLEFAIVAPPSPEENPEEPQPATILSGPKAKILTYTGEAQKLVSAGMVSGGYMLYSLDGINYSKSIPMQTEAGEYTVWFRVKGDDTHTDADGGRLTVTIDKAEPTLTLMPAAKALTENGQAQELVTAGTADGGELLYSLDSDNYSSQIPSASVAGQYTVWYYIQGDANHTDSKSDQLTSFIVGQGDPAFIPPTTPELTYNGAAQALITAGQVEGGILQYSNDGEIWTDEIPTSIVPGTYTVWYQVKANEESEPIAIVSLTSIILPAPLTITADNKTIYDGEQLPALTCSYSGFVGTETETILDTPPTLSTEASATSGIGGYDITVSGATAANYMITHVNGRLIISPTFKDEATGENVSAVLIEEEDGTLKVALTTLPDGFYDGTANLPPSLLGSDGEDYPVNYIAAEAFDEMPEGTVVTLPDGFKTTEPVPNVINGDGTCTILDLTNVETFDTPKAINVDVVIMERTFNEERQTVCLPYDYELKEGMTAFTLTSKTNGVAIFSEVTDRQLKAYKPYVLYVKHHLATRQRDSAIENVNETIDLGVKNVLIDATREDEYTEVEDLRWYGTVHGLTHKKAEEINAYILQEDGSWMMTASAAPEYAKTMYLPAFHAYLCSETTGDIIGSNLEEQTGITTVTAHHHPSDGAWYDLTGRKLNGEPQKPGVYVKDGKKIVKKVWDFWK